MMGLVLCGGQSTRMGMDKGLLQHQSATWAQLAADKLKQLQLQTIISVNTGQYDTYSKLFQNLIVVADENTLGIGGPLKGLLSVHVQYREADLLVLACDMRDMQVPVLEHLHTTFNGTPADAVVYRNGSNVEPLCGVYAAGGLKKVYNLYRQGHLKKFNMQSVLQLLQTAYLPMPKSWVDAFKNFNSFEDLRSL